MANAALYFHDGLRPQPLPVDKSLSGVRIHREVPDLKRRKILEEMAALRWRHAQVTQSRLYDHPGSGDLIPCNWDSEPWVVRPPTTNPDEQIWCAVLAQQFFAFTRQHQRTYLEKSKIGGFFRSARHLDRELDFHGAPERVFPDAH